MDIGDDVRCDVEIDDSVGVDTREMDFEDCRVEFGYDISAGATGEFTMTFDVLGPVELDGVTYIAAR